MDLFDLAIPRTFFHPLTVRGTPLMVDLEVKRQLADRACAMTTRCTSLAEIHTKILEVDPDLLVEFDGKHNQVVISSFVPAPTMAERLRKFHQNSSHCLVIDRGKKVLLSVADREKLFSRIAAFGEQEIMQTCAQFIRFSTYQVSKRIH